MVIVLNLKILSREECEVRSELRGINILEKIRSLAKRKMLFIFIKFYLFEGREIETDSDTE